MNSLFCGCPGVGTKLRYFRRLKAGLCGMDGRTVGMAFRFWAKPVPNVPIRVGIVVTLAALYGAHRFTDWYPKQASQT